MPDSDRKKIKDQQKGVYAVTSGITNPGATVGEMHEETFTWQKPAGAALAEVGFQMKKAGRVKSIRVSPSATLATHGSNYVTGTVAKRDGAGGNAETIGAYTTNSSGGAALTAWTTTDVPVDVDTRDFAAGDWLTFAEVDAGTTTEVALGVAVTVEYGVA